MKYPTRAKPISYAKASAAELIRELGGKREVKAVMQDYEQTQETLALLKILALGNRQIDEGRVVPAREAVRRARGKIARL